MLSMIPRCLPTLPLILEDLGQPAAADLARALDVSPRAARRWQTEDQAPRPVHLALFWLTRWGRSEIDCRAVNDARLQAQLCACAQREAAELRADLARLNALASYGSANEPLFAHR
jgi:hypothetical protein